MKITVVIYSKTTCRPESEMSSEIFPGLICSSSNEFRKARTVNVVPVTSSGRQGPITFIRVVFPSCIVKKFATTFWIMQDGEIVETPMMFNGKSEYITSSNSRNPLRASHEHPAGIRFSSIEDECIAEIGRCSAFQW